MGEITLAWGAYRVATWWQCALRSAHMGQGLRGRSAAHIARKAGLGVLFIDEPESVRLIAGCIVVIGPKASERAILEIAYRHWLGLRGPVDEAELSHCVAAHELGPVSTRGSGSHAPIAASR